MVGEEDIQANAQEGGMKNAVERKGMRRSWSTGRVVCLMLAILLLVGSLFGISWVVTHSDQEEETRTLVQYRHTGNFDYEAYAKYGSLYGRTAPAETPTPVYFLDIIESVDVSFSYSLVPKGEVTSVSENVEIVAVLENPGVWRKELVLVPQTTEISHFELNFPLDVHALDDLAKTIDEETSSFSDSIDLTLVANVHVLAQTNSEVVEDDFVQTTKLLIETTTLEWEKGLTMTEAVSHDGWGFEQSGEFDYAVHLKENALYGPVTLRPPSEEESQPPVLLPKGITYFPEIIDSINPSYSYDFQCSESPVQASSTVEIIALLEYPKIWQKTLVLLPSATQESDFAVSFPLDLDQLIQFTDTVREEIGLGSATYDITITANVHLVAETTSGTIDEVFTQSLIGSLSPTTFKWNTQLDKVQPGQITETVYVSRWSWPLLVGAIVALLLALLLFTHVGLSQEPSRSRSRSALERQASQAKRKHKDAIVDILSLPEVQGDENVVSVDSLEDLVRAADDLLKPVLHKAEPRKHIYSVIDGPTRYVYTASMDGGEKQQTQRR